MPGYSWLAAFQVTSASNCGNCMEFRLVGTGWDTKRPPDVKLQWHTKLPSKHRCVRCGCVCAVCVCVCVLVYICLSVHLSFSAWPPSRLVFGTFNGKACVCMQGRFPLYEYDCLAYSMQLCCKSHKSLFHDLTVTARTSRSHYQCAFSSWWVWRRSWTD